MPVRVTQHDYIDVTAFGDTQKTYLVLDRPDKHVPFGLSNTHSVCIGCGCCSTYWEDLYYCGQCRIGLRP